MDGFESLRTTLVQQAQLYQEILDISAAQVELCRQLDEDDASLDGLLQMIDHRQAIMEQIDELMLRLHKLREEIGLIGPDGQSAAVELGSERYDEYRLRVQKILNLVSSICANDEKSQELLQGKLNHITQKLNELRTGRKALQAYTGEVPPGGAWFFDKKK